ncbi:MAG: hypothetical protein ACREHG_07375 [Candidatus Saccharimonadales bacterium]
MYNTKDIQFVGKYDYDELSAREFASLPGETCSIGIFRWQLKKNGKELKRGPVEVRVITPHANIDLAVISAENIVKQLDMGEWDGRNTVRIK